MKRVIGILLAASILMNIVLIYTNIDHSKKLNTTWFNSISKLESAIAISQIPSTAMDKLDDYTLTSTKYNLQSLQLKLMDLQVLPEGGRIVSSTTIQKVMALTNYEFQLIDIMEKDLKSSQKISSDNIERFRRTNQSWQRMLETLESEGNKIYPFSPTFQVTKWQVVLENATGRLGETDLMPLP